MARLRRCWDDLPQDLAALVATRLPFFADAIRMSAMCRSWRAGALQERPRPRPPQLPWLLLPYRRVCEHPPRGVRVAGFFCVEDFLTRRFKIPTDTGGARFFGSYPGGWLFVACGQTSGHTIFNLHNHHREKLPDAILSTELLPGPGAVVIQRPSAPTDVGVIMLAATLSCSPVPRQDCVAAAIIALLIPPDFPKRIAMWRMGSQQISCWFPQSDVDPQSDVGRRFDVEDLMFYNGRFHFLTSEGNLILCEPLFQKDAPLEQLQGAIEARQFVPVIFGRGHVKARYLVVSRGELLMVVRIAPTAEKPSCTFRIFQADVDEGRWNELYELDGRMLFVGRGSSRCYEAEHYSGWAGVYYHDECYNETSMIHGGKDREYPTSDNGIWSGPPENVLTFVYRALAPSLYSSPVWFHP
ncbi:unnamed protein product [Urochloa humidicola]